MNKKTTIRKGISKKDKLLEKQQKLCKELASIGPFIAGSLNTHYRICGSKSCRCRKGGPKHKAMYFTWKENKVTKSMYVPVAFHKEAVVWTKNYKKLKQIIASISKLQVDIVNLR